MQAHGPVCKLMDLHASLCNCMQHSGTFWNILVVYFQLVHGHTDRHKDLMSCVCRNNKMRFRAKIHFGLQTIGSSIDFFFRRDTTMARLLMAIVVVFFCCHSTKIIVNFYEAFQVSNKRRRVYIIYECFFCQLGTK